MPRALILLLALASPLCAADLRWLPAPLARKVDFKTDVQPLLERACAGCHGPEKQRGSYRLDHGPTALKAIKPRESAGSKLIHLVAGWEEGQQMPPGEGKALKFEEIALLRAWIDQGAVFPPEMMTAKPRSAHWAFQPVRRVAPPPLGNHPIDGFVLDRLAKEKIDPSPKADRVTLIRRLSLDLLGLPPTPDDVDAFVNDKRPDAYERVVDRILASPAYGERWARHWLDIARYADSDGYEKDGGRPHAWRYRHWVIQSLNRNLPYDQFVIEQLAGDLLPGPSVDQKVATGFHRNTLTNKEGGIDKEQYRVEAIVDRVNTTARAFLGLTLGCAQCHDHKYDPLTQKEYYQFFAFFNGDEEADIEAPAVGFRLPPSKTGKNVGVRAMTMHYQKHRPTHVMTRGDFMRPGAAVSAKTPAVLPALSASEPTRLDLARWIASPDNPLTARVIANWTWHKFFGRGLVLTLDDFGTQGEKPSHPRLLDWLASELVLDGWDLKRLHRVIVTSATYRQSSAVRPEVRAKDPYNVLLSRQARVRLEAEAIRDTMLASSGLLAPVVSGPSVRPPQPAGISELTYAGAASWVESKGLDRHRRGMYTWFQRTSPYPMLLTFDAPDSNVCTVKRDATNTPLQALTLLNDKVFVECAQSLGRRVLTEAKGNARMTHLFRLCTARAPTEKERARLVKLYEELKALCEEDAKGAAELLGDRPTAGATVAEAAAWLMVARAVLNLDEVVTRE